VGEDGGLIAGHARVLAARQLGIAKIPVMVAAGWTEAQKVERVLGTVAPNRRRTGQHLVQCHRRGIAFGVQVPPRRAAERKEGAPTLPLPRRVRAPARERLPEIKGRGRQTRSSGGRSSG
jgi:hypothetical protein